MGTIIDFARAKLIERHVKPGDSVMFDIDDTLISSRSGFPNALAVDILNLSKVLGYTIVIITARPDTEQVKRHTKEQLEKFKIYYDLLIFCPADKKIECKKNSKKCYILSVGDQLTDLDGGLYFIKMPDYTDMRYYTGTSNTSIGYCN